MAKSNKADRLYKGTMNKPDRLPKGKLYKGCLRVT